MHYPKPQRPQFSSGPCAKRPGWSPSVLASALLGHSHRSQVGVARIAAVYEQTRQILEIPASYVIALINGSATAAMEAILWNLIGARGVDAVDFDVFSHRWVGDLQHLIPQDLRVFEGSAQQLPDLGQVNFERDVMLVWNGTASGLAIPSGEWIPRDRGGLVLCDATSAAFATDLPWEKLDAVAFSWQKGLGGEGAHGMVVLSPRALARLETYTPQWPIPYLMRFKDGETVRKNLFEAKLANTPSMLCVEDALDALAWAQAQGGLKGLLARVQRNYETLCDLVARSSFLDFMVADPAQRSKVSVTLKITTLEEMGVASQWRFVETLCALLIQHQVAYDIKNHVSTTPGLRLWCGPTVEAEDIAALGPWLEWAYKETQSSL
ncbi:MAG: phosphoserine transaminase [Holosporales bacterium]